MNFVILSSQVPTPNERYQNLLSEILEKSPSLIVHAAIADREGEASGMTLLERLVALDLSKRSW